MFEFNGQCPKWMFYILRWFGLTIGEPWDPELARQASDLIEDNKLDEAIVVITKMMEKDGVSTEVIRLKTRISRINIIGR